MLTKELSLNRQYRISKWRYRELKAICMQYAEYKLQARDQLGTRAVQFDTDKSGSGVGDPTMIAAQKRIRALELCETIERTAQYADPFNARLLLRSVTSETGYDRLVVQGYIGSRAGFFRARRKFFWMLDQML